MDTNLCTGILLTATMNYLYLRYHEIKHTNGLFDRAKNNNNNNNNNNKSNKTKLFTLKFHNRALTFRHLSFTFKF